MSHLQVLAVSGSTRQQSINHSLIKAIADLAGDTVTLTVYNSITDLPQFNPDDDGPDVDPSVTAWRDALNAADGILICTPEYAHGVPGSLKNAIDWTISSSEFPHKPTMLITAATDGKFGHHALLETLKTIEAGNVANLQMVISFAKTKISNHGTITDENTLKDIKLLLRSFIDTIGRSKNTA